MSLKKQALSGVFWSAMQLVGTQGITFVVTLILARLLLPSEFGLIAMLSIFMGIGGLLINGGLTHSLIRTADADQEDYSTVFYFNLAGSVVIYGIIFLCAPLIASFYNQGLLTDLIRVYAITFIINAFGSVQTTRLTKIMDFKTQLKVSIPSLILGSLVGITMAYSGYGVWSLVGSAVVQSVAGTIQLWYWSNWIPSRSFSVSKFKYHFNFGVKLMLSGILNVIFTNVYTIVIGKFFAPAQVGYYSTANSLQMLPVGNISTIVTKVSYPLFASIQNDDIRLKSIYKRIMQMVIYLVTPTLVLMTVLAEPMFRFLFTEKWLPAVPYFQILFINGILYPIHSYNLQILNVKGRSDLYLKLEIFKKSLLVVVLVVSFQYGIFGILYGGVFTSIFAFFINTHYSGKFIGYSAWEQAKDLAPIFLLGLFVGLIVYGSDTLFFDAASHDFIRLLVGGTIGILLYVGISYTIKMRSFMELRTIILRKSIQS